MAEELLDACLAEDPRKSAGIGGDNFTCLIVQLKDRPGAWVGDCACLRSFVRLASWLCGVCGVRKGGGGAHVGLLDGWRCRVWVCLFWVGGWVVHGCSRFALARPPEGPF